jgi:hypothetical protein
LQHLDEKVIGFHEILLKKDRRGLVNWAGNIMKTLTVTATLADVNKLHSILDVLRQQNSELTNSLKQVTHKQKLKTAEKYI